MPSELELKAKCTPQCYALASHSLFSSTVEVLSKLGCASPTYTGCVKGGRRTPYTVKVLLLPAGKDAKAQCDGVYCDCEKSWCKHAVGFVLKLASCKPKDINTFVVESVLEHRYTYYRDDAGTITSQRSVLSYPCCLVLSCSCCLALFSIESSRVQVGVPDQVGWLADELGLLGGLRGHPRQGAFGQVRTPL
jgi:hypothetical protein